MPKHVCNLLTEALNKRRLAVNGSRVLVVGVAYKSDIDDVRESPALDIMTRLDKMGAEVQWYDPHVEHLEGSDFGSRLDRWDLESLREFEAALIVTPHKTVDHALLLEAGITVVDTRNALKGCNSQNLRRL